MKSRIIDPLFFKDEFIGELEPLAMVTFIGLWCLADREGRLEDRPKWINAELFPYSNVITCDDIERQLNTLSTIHPFIQRYTVDGKRFIQITNFSKHQHVHPHERRSIIPKCTDVITCHAMSGALTSTLTSTSYPLKPPTEEFALSAEAEPSSPSKVRRSKRNSTDYTPDFEGWWAIFPRKDAKVAAFKAWRSLSASDKDAAFAGINRQLPKIEERIAEKGEDGCPHGATWINQRRWEDGGVNASQVLVIPNATPRPLPDRQCEIDSMNAQYEALKAKGLV